MDVLIDNWIIGLIPFFAAFVGWITNVLAVQMMFYPVEFFGIKPFLGWQGIVPANARPLAAKSTEIITEKLINLGMVFENFDAASFAGGNLGAALDELTEQVIAETASKYAAETWEEMPGPVKDQVRQLLRGEIQKVAVDILAEVGDDIEEIIDLKTIVMDAVDRDKRLIGEMFQRVGVDEFAFIRRSGAYFGGLFGVIQMGAWIAYPAWWILPFFGFFVGYVTNWLAIKLIFEPPEPTKLGPFTIQGLFHKRQHEVAEEFAKLVSGEILNTENMVAHMIRGEAGEKLFGIVEKHIDAMLDRYKDNPFTATLVPADKLDEIRAELLARLREELPREGGFLWIFVSRAIDVYSELFERMTELDSQSFEGLLRPPFQKDEWKLILAGAVLGFGAGVLQVVYLFGDQTL